MTAERVSVAVFKAANNWPLYVAVANGYLEEAGTRAEVVHISSSKEQMAGLIGGEYRIIHTAADNVVAPHVERDSVVPVEKRPKIFMGGDDGFLSVYSSGWVRSFGDLKGKRVGFDSATSGFAFVLKKILSAEGLREGDYSELVVGGTESRYKALVAGSIDAAIMTPPYDLLCSASGLTKLGEAARYLPRYQGVVGACCPDTFPAPFLREYKAALVKGLIWLGDRGNKQAATDILKESLEVPADQRLFSDLYDSVLSKKGGFNPGGNVDLEGLERVMTLRKEFSKTASPRPLAEFLMPVVSTRQ